MLNAGANHKGRKEHKILGASRPGPTGYDKMRKSFLSSRIKTLKTAKLYCIEQKVFPKTVLNVVVFRVSSIGAKYL